jgi:protein Mpv17
VATAAVLGGAGDFVAQLAESATKTGSAGRKFDSTRGLSMIAFSAIYTGAFQAWWISTLQANVHMSNQVLDAAVKTGLCQFGTIPLVYMPTFFLVTGAVRGMDLQASFENGKQNYLRIYSRNVLYWIPVQMCQFLYVPQEWQIPFLCAGGFT